MTRNILTICLGNHCRSPIAEALLVDLAKRRGLDWHVRSAGLTGLVSVPPNKKAIAVMDEVSIDIRMLLGDQLTKSMIEWSDHVLVMEQAHADEVEDMVPGAGSKVVLLDPKEIADPMGRDLATFRAVRDQLRECIEAWAEGL